MWTEKNRAHKTSMGSIHALLKHFALADKLKHTMTNLNIARNGEPLKATNHV